jgi:hypothetical protein
MLRARVAVGVCAAATVAGTLALTGEGGAPRAGAGEPCAHPESTYTTDSLHDIRSFADAMAIVRAVRQQIPPPPSGPEGWAGLIGRRVTVKVERVLWRRPHAPQPPQRFRFSDWGWTGTLENRTPIRPCGETRMVLGRRYLAPIVRHNGTWYPFFPTRLQVRGSLVVGGVDAGQPENSHQALAGRSVRGAVRLVANTLPYRSVVLDPSGSPARRWQRVDRDEYRVWRQRPGMPVTVTSGVVPRSRWVLYLRLPARGGMCVGMFVRALWHPVPAPSGEGCGPRRLAPEALLGSSFFARHRGTFVFGRVGPRAGVRVRVDDGEWQAVRAIPTPIPPGGREYFWIVPLPRGCTRATVQAYDRDGNVTGELYAACLSG